MECSLVMTVDATKIMLYASVAPVAVGTTRQQHQQHQQQHHYNIYCHWLEHVAPGI